MKFLCPIKPIKWNSRLLSEDSTAQGNASMTPIYFTPYVKSKVFNLCHIFV